MRGREEREWDADKKWDTVVVARATWVAILRVLAQVLEDGRHVAAKDILRHTVDASEEATTGRTLRWSERPTRLLLANIAAIVTFMCTVEPR